MRLIRLTEELYHVPSKSEMMATGGYPKLESGKGPYTSDINDHVIAVACGAPEVYRELGATDTIYVSILYIDDDNYVYASDEYTLNGDKNQDPPFYSGSSDIMTEYVRVIKALKKCKTDEQMKNG